MNSALECFAHVQLLGLSYDCQVHRALILFPFVGSSEYVCVALVTNLLHHQHHQHKSEILLNPPLWDIYKEYKRALMG